MKFNFLSIPVTVRGSFWLFSILSSMSRLDQPLLIVEWTAVMIIALLVHELGHAAAFKYYGHRPAIALHGMGGLTYSLEGGQALSPGREAVIAFAGPFAGYLLGLCVWGISQAVSVAPSGELWPILISDLLWASWGWSTLNLCPMLPLDGGLLLLAALRARWEGKAQVAAHGISIVVAIAAMMASRNAGWTWTLALSVWFAAINGHALVQAYQLAQAPKTPRSKDELFIKAQRLACETWLQRGDLQRAWEAAKDLPDSLLSQDFLAGFRTKAWEHKHLRLAEALAARQFSSFSDRTCAVDAARAAAADGRLDAAFKWLELALPASREDWELWSADSYLSALQTDPRWQVLKDLSAT